MLMHVCVYGVARGAFSEVYKAVNRATKEHVAIKIINKASLKGKEDALVNEIAVLKK